MRELVLSDSMRRVLKWVGYPLFAVVVFWSTLYLTLPRDRIKERVETLASNALGTDVTIGDLGLTFFTGPGVEVEDVVLRTRPHAPGEKPQRYVIDEAVVHPGLIDLARNQPSMRFSVQVAGGTVGGSARMGTEEKGLSLEAHTLALSQIPGLVQAVGLPLEGTMDLTGQLTAPKGQVAQASGRFDLACEGCVVGDGKAKLKVPGNPLLAEGLTIPRLKLGRLQGAIVIDKGRATFQDLRSRSPDVELAVEGYIELREPIQFSVLHLYLRFRPSDALVKREPTLELLVNVVGAQGKRPDGFLGFSVTGTFQTPLALPAREPPPGVTASKLGGVAAAGGPTAGAGRPPPPGPGVNFGRPTPPPSSFPSGEGALPGPPPESPPPENPIGEERPSFQAAGPPPPGVGQPVLVAPANAIPPPAAGNFRPPGEGEGAPPPPPPGGGEEAQPEQPSPAPAPEGLRTE